MMPLVVAKASAVRRHRAVRAAYEGEECRAPTRRLLDLGVPGSAHVRDERQRDEQQATCLGRELIPGSGP